MLSRPWQVGNLLPRLPQPNFPYNGTHSATAFGPRLQQNMGFPVPPGLAAGKIGMITNLRIAAIFPFEED